LSLHIPSWHAVLYDLGESDHRPFQSNDVDMAFAESRTARHSQNSRNPFHAGDGFRGFLVHTFATACQVARPPRPDLTTFAADGAFTSRLSTDRPVAGYDCSSDWTPLLTGLSPARMAASLAAPTPSL